MAEKNCEVLFEYLRSILYDREIKRPDLDALDEDFQRLGAGLLVLEKNVEEMRNYTKELAAGNLSAAVPPRENLLCGNLKSLHANLKHLSWQTRQIADGDYSQKVNYLGDFSDAFNEMIFQLSDREKRLKEMAEEAKRLEEFNTNRLARQAFRDPGTGIYNRRFFTEQMEKFLKEKRKGTLAYLDLDGLKRVNDQFGHAEGDLYILRFVQSVEAFFGTAGLFARIGGDEFCILSEGESPDGVRERLCQAGLLYSQECGEKYPAGFSYGIVPLDGSREPESLEEILRDADVEMYRDKRKKRENETNPL